MKILRTCCALIGSLSLALSLSAQTFSIVHSFDGADGGHSGAGLIQGTDGSLYGTTGDNGANGYGTVFRISPSGTLKTLHSFDGTDGGSALAPLVQATNGNFYGTTGSGGASNLCVQGCGTVFKITPAGTLITLHSFDITDGVNVYAGLIQASDRSLYGTTAGGGANGWGTVFKITLGGTLATLHSFDNTDGAVPEAGLAEAANGNFYGTTFEGGATMSGTVFKITPRGTLTTLHSFDYYADGVEPRAGLVQATDGNFYGTTYGYGANDFGTVFKITPSGTLTTLHRFNGVDGESPDPSLIQATDGKFYGTTSGGGAHGVGTLFTITSNGTLTTLHSFDGTDGAVPVGRLVQDTNGTLYGTTNEGGASNTCVYGCGTVFRLSVGLGPFVETQPTSGKVGAKVIIMGTNLIGTSSVSFDGIAATFMVVSKSEIKTTVPAGAATGKVEVTTPKKTLKSNVFRVTK